MNVRTKGIPAGPGRIEFYEPGPDPDIPILVSRDTPQKKQKGR